MRAFPVVLFAESRSLARRIERVMPGAFAVTVAATPSEISSLGADSVAVIATERADASWLDAALEAARNRVTPSGIVVVTPFDANNAAAIARRGPVIVSWMHEVPMTLPRMLRQAMESRTRSATLLRFAGLLDTNDGFIRKLLGQVIAVPTPRSVQELARHLHCSPNTLRYRWRDKHMPGTPRDIVQLAMLLRLGQIIESGTPLANAIKALRVPHSTAFRRAQRWLGTTPAKLDSRRVWYAIEEWSCSDTSLGFAGKAESGRNRQSD